MGILVGLPRTGGSEKDLQLNFGQSSRSADGGAEAFSSR